MSYSPTTWVDGSAPDIDAANLNHLEQGVQAAAATADAAVPAPASPASNDAMVWNGSAWTHAKIADANVSATAQIAYGKLTLTSSIVNADIASAAAIAASKLASYPSDGTKFLAGDGTWKAASSTSYRKTTAKTVNNTVTETDLLNSEITLAAGVMGTTGVARLTAWGDLLQNTGGTTAAVEFKLKLGATTLLDTGVGTAAQMIQASATRRSWRITAEIENLGAANSQWATLSGVIAALSNGGGVTAFTTGEGIYWAAASSPTTMQGANSGAVDTSASQALVLSAILPTASASCEIVLKGALVEIV